jgi:hypothetical protein
MIKMDNYRRGITMFLTKWTITLEQQLAQGEVAPSQEHMNDLQNIIENGFKVLIADFNKKSPASLKLTLFTNEL